MVIAEFCCHSQLQDFLIDHFGTFNELLSTQNVNVAHFAHGLISEKHLHSCFYCQAEPEGGTQH